MIETKAHSTGPRCLKLVFRNKISLPVLNGEEIKGEGGKFIEIALVDEVTGNVIDFGQEASAHVGIVALEGDSDHCERDTWVIGNYKKKNVSVSVSEEKRSVLAGKVKLKLNKGIGSLANLKFRNSANHNSGVFKLGAKVIDSFDGTLIKEAMTEPFVVKDFREKCKYFYLSMIILLCHVSPNSETIQCWHKYEKNKRRKKDIKQDGCPTYN